jgi:hypothetical protein
MKANTVTGSGIIFDIQSWVKTNLYLIQPVTIIGQTDGIVIVDHNDDAAPLDRYLSQTFGANLVITSDILFIEFDYKIINNTATAYTSQLLYLMLHDVAASQWLSVVDASACEWINHDEYLMFGFDAPIGVSEWITVKRTIPGLPVNGSFIIKLFALLHNLVNVYVAFKNIRVYSTADEMVIKSQLAKKPFGEIFFWGKRPKIYYIELKDNAEIIEKRYILENTKSGQRIKGIDLEYEYLVGDVTDANIDNVIEQFEGAKAVGTVTGYTGGISKVDTATFHTTAGSGTISCNGYSHPITWDTDVNTTLENFMTSWSTGYGSVTLAKTSGTTITFTGALNFTTSVSASFGSVVNTTPYYIGDASYTLAPTAKWNTLSPGGESRPLLEIIGGEIGFQHSRAKQLIQMKIHDEDTRIELTIVLIPISKLYDGNTTAETYAYILLGLEGSDVVMVNTSSGSFDTATIGTGKTVVAIVTLSGTDAAKYKCNTIATSDEGVICNLRMEFHAQNKAYDGTTGITVIMCHYIVADAVYGTNLTAFSQNGRFIDKYVGTAKVCWSTVGCTGTDSSKYVIANYAKSTANIT